MLAVSVMVLAIVAVLPAVGAVGVQVVPLITGARRHRGSSDSMESRLFRESSRDGCPRRCRRDRLRSLEAARMSWPNTLSSRSP